MYCTWESIDTDDGPRTTDHRRQTHFKSFLLPDTLNQTKKQKNKDVTEFEFLERIISQIWDSLTQT